ncbi:hypothetical protein C8Q79DRAFT_210982 [Trametes meyenii]|nr:hypothetical protein C8Q79DRAFT_210982 [Trametes meyenii]
MADGTTNTASPTYPLPPYVYKILPSPPPSPLPAALPLSDLDREDGFIHLSTAAQTPTTASLFFAAHTALTLLKVDTRATVRAPEEGGPGGVYKWVEGLPGCPHLYASAEGAWVDLGSGNVRGWREVHRGDGQEWGEVLKGLCDEGWLVDE